MRKGAATVDSQRSPEKPITAVTSMSSPSPKAQAHSGAATVKVAASISDSDAPHTAVCTPNQPTVTTPTMSDTTQRAPPTPRAGAASSAVGAPVSDACIETKHIYMTMKPKPAKVAKAEPPRPRPSPKAAPTISVGALNMPPARMTAMAFQPLRSASSTHRSAPSPFDSMAGASPFQSLAHRPHGANQTPPAYHRGAETAV